MNDLKYVFLLKIINGKPSLGSEANQARFKDFCKNHEGKTLRLTYEKPVRSMQQNRLYWAYLNLLEIETGNNARFLHEFFKRTLLPPKFIKLNINGKKQEIKVPASTTELNKSDFCEYIMKIEAETEIKCPDPKDLKDYIPN